MEPYRVPFLLDRSRAPIYRLVNVGSEPVRGVTLTLIGSGIMPAVAPVTLHPTEALEVTIRGDELQLVGALLIRWLRPTGDDYLWRVTF